MGHLVGLSPKKKQKTAPWKMNEYIEAQSQDYFNVNSTAPI
jgi:hypothetical protein